MFLLYKYRTLVFFIKKTLYYKCFFSCWCLFYESIEEIIVVKLLGACCLNSLWTKKSNSTTTYIEKKYFKTTLKKLYILHQIIKNIIIKTTTTTITYVQCNNQPPLSTFLQPLTPSLPTFFLGFCVFELHSAAIAFYNICKAYCMSWWWDHCSNAY